MIKQILFLCFAFFVFGCKSAKISDKSFTSKDIVVKKVKDHVYQHITFLQTQDFGKVSCNGMVVFDKNEAVVFDTPINDSTSLELIKWVKDSLGCKIIAIIPTHFHEDCLGGLEAFHQLGIPSYASNKTIQSAKLANYPVPQNGFDELLKLKVGNKEVIAEFHGEGHTRDNVTGYFPSEKVVFGGCLIKEIGAGKGYLGDANVNAWPATVTKLKEKYPETQVVIPGHGQTGDTALFDYTIKLFRQK